MKYFTLLLVFSVINSYSNEVLCDFDEINHEYDLNHQDEYEKRLLFEKKIQSKKLHQFNPPNAETAYRIPVVFHIYGTDFSGRVIDEQKIRDALNDVNDDFRGKNDTVSSLFESIEGVSDIQFYLAQIDPHGNSTNGIIYHPYEEGFGLNGSTDEAISQYAWDNRKYMNVYIQLIIKSGSKNNSGIAWLPREDMMEEGTARVVYNGKYLIYAPPASSLTHEFGHFLGLYHTFDNGGCSIDGGDEVDDTPATIGSLGCGEQLNCFGEAANTGNHMDYNPCEDMFTEGQVTRMQGYLAHPARINLWQEQNLQATGYHLLDSPRVLMNYSELEDTDILKQHNFQEQLTNEGTLEGQIKIRSTQGIEFSNSFTSSDWSTSGLPDGLIPQLEFNNDSTLILTLEGQALNHSEADDTEFELNISTNMVRGTPDVNDLSGKFSIQFLDPYTLITGKPNHQIYMGWSMQNEASIDLGYQSSLIGGNLSIDITNFDGDMIMIDNLFNNYEILTYTGTNHVIPLRDSTQIGQQLSGTWFKRSSIEQYGAIVSSPEYKEWAGQRKYAAFRVPQNNGTDYLYGWFEIYVEPNNKTARVIAYAMNENSNSNLSTYQEGVPDYDLYEDRFLESASQPGVYSNTLRLELVNQRFNQLGRFTVAEGLMVSQVPRGMALELEVTSATSALIHLKGVKERHEWRDNLKSMKLTIPSSFFNQSHSEIELSLSLESHGESFIETAAKEWADTNNVNNGWLNFMSSGMSLGRNITYQFQYYSASNTDNQPGFKFISWRKDAMANENFELTPLDSLAPIDSNASWQPGKEYWSGPGQHLVQGENFNAWRGQHKYIGIRINRSGQFFYGWIKAEMNSEGSEVRFTEYGVMGTPEVGILAGTIREVEETTVSVLGENEKLQDPKVYITDQQIRIEGSFDLAEIYNHQGQLIQSTHENTMNWSPTTSSLLVLTYRGHRAIHSLKLK